MEFEHIGRHCSLPSCNQKDFLPFKCDYCKRDYCLAHRSFDGHGCDGALSRDMTTVECPLCKKSVKFDKTQDPNLIWEEHYLHGCPHEAPQNIKQHCGKASCRNVLGPSNTFSCTKCHMKVCISHRLPEDHNCSSLGTNSRQKFLENLENKTATTSGNKAVTGAPVNRSTSKSSSAANSKASSSSKVAKVDESNTLRGTAARRMPNNNANALSTATVHSRSTAGEFICPFNCGQSFNDPVVLTQHVEAVHQGSGSTTALSTPNTDTEQCPVCSQRFADAALLVSHYETAHGSRASTSTSTEKSCLLN
jgi:predicted nucleic acid binding AN1-type Zn finger protein